MGTPCSNIPSRELRVFGTNENAVRHFTPAVLSIYFALYARNANGVLFPRKDRLREKMKVDRSTLTRWIATLLHHGLAQRQADGSVKLIRPREVNAKANGGRNPRHKTTLLVNVHDQRKEIEEKLLLPLLDEYHRQVTHVRREAKIEQKLFRKYGRIHDPKIKETVKSRVSVMEEMGQPMSGKSIAGRLNISERHWAKIKKRWIAKGWIDSFRNEKSVGYMNPLEYQAAKPHFPYATYRRMTGEVIRVLPCLIHINTDYSAKRRKAFDFAAGGATSTPSPLDKWSFILVDIGGRKTPFPVLTAGLFK